MIPRARLLDKWYYQCIQSRYGFSPHHLMPPTRASSSSAGLQGRARQPPDGPEVTEQVAGCGRPGGIDQRSPAATHWLGDDLSLKIQEIRGATIPDRSAQARASRVYDDVRMATKCQAGHHLPRRAEGGTGAGRSSPPRDGIPLMAAIRARRALEDVGLADEIDLVVAAAS